MGCFDWLCTDVGCTPAERDALAWHLAMLRARRTYEALRQPATLRQPEPRS